MNRGNYFDEIAYIEADVSAGTLRTRGGTRVVALTSEFLHAMSSSLATECGPAAGRVLKAAGRAWGKRFAAQIEGVLGDYEAMPLREVSFGEFAGRLAAAFSHHGFGILTLDTAHTGIGVLTATITGSPEPPELLAGFVAGVLSHFSGEDLDAMPTQLTPMLKLAVTLPSRLDRVADAVHRGLSHEEVLAALTESRAE
ncbi:MAG: hypothetical protein U0746_02265 [Gemmataceae bacterium]